MRRAVHARLSKPDRAARRCTSASGRKRRMVGWRWHRWQRVEFGKAAVAHSAFPASCLQSCPSGVHAICDNTGVMFLRPDFRHRSANKAAAFPPRIHPRAGFQFVVFREKAHFHRTQRQLYSHGAPFGHRCLPAAGTQGFDQVGNQGSLRPGKNSVHLQPRQGYSCRDDECHVVDMANQVPYRVSPKEATMCAAVVLRQGVSLIPSDLSNRTCSTCSVESPRGPVGGDAVAAAGPFHTRT